MLKRSLALIFSLLILSSMSSALTGAPYFVSNGVTLSAASATRNEGAKIISDGAGNFIIAWVSGSEEDRDIFAQKLDSAGNPVWSAPIPICTATLAQKEVQMVSDGGTGAILAWFDMRDGSTYNIYAQRINSAGTVQWTINGKKVCEHDWEKELLRMDGDGMGGAVLTWQDSRITPINAAPNIAAQKINSTGDVQWPQPVADYNGIIIYDASGEQTNPSIAAYVYATEKIGAMIAFNDLNAGILRAKVVKLANDGQPGWAGIAKDASNWDASKNPEVLHDGSGGAFVAIEVSNPAESRYGIELQKLASDTGERQWIIAGEEDIHGLVRYTTSPYLVNPHIVRDGAGGLVVAWSEGTGSQFDICAARVDSTGALIFPASVTERNLVCSAPNLQLLNIGSDSQAYLKPMTGTNDNSAIIAWSDFRRAPGITYSEAIDPGPSSGEWEVDIYAQKIDLLADGTARWMANGVPLSTAVYAQGAPVLCQDGNGAGAVWYDARFQPSTVVGAQKVMDLTPNISSYSPTYGGVRTLVTLNGAFGADATQLNGDPAYGGSFNQVLFDTTLVPAEDVTWANDRVTLVTPTIAAGFYNIEVKGYGEDSNRISFTSTTGTGPVVSLVKFGVKEKSYAEDDYVDTLPLISAQVESPSDFYLGSISLTIDGGSSINVPLTEYSVTTKRFSHQLTAAETGGTGLTDGSHAIVIYSVDAYENTGTPFTCNVRVDSSAPTSVVSTVSYPGGGTYFDPSGGASGASAKAAGNVVTIAYTLPNSVPIEYILYSSAGLVSGRSIPAGTVGALTGYNEITWDGRLPTGEFVGSGIYPYQLVSGGKVISRGYIVVKHSR